MREIPPKLQYSSELLPPSVLKKIAGDSSETSILIFQFTRRRIQQSRNLCQQLTIMLYLLSQCFY
jgi:hypothetical protein